MAKYEWGNPSLRRRSTTCTWVALVFMILVLVSISVFPNLQYIALACVGIATVLMIIGYRAQSEDRKMKKDKQAHEID